MNFYCLVEDNSISQGPAPIPGSWKNISGLDCLSDEKLKVLGWLPVREIIPTFDTVTEKLGSIILDSILEDEVLYTKEVLAITDEERIVSKIEEIEAIEYESNRVAAIEDLKTDGTLPSDYVD